MKVIIPVVATLSATLAMAHPRPKVADDPLQQTSRITAFIVDDKGDPSVECWEITSVLESNQVKRADGSQATAHAMSIALGHELEGVDILTWPPYSMIWPAPTQDAVHNQATDLQDAYSLFNVQGGLVALLVDIESADARAGIETKDDEYPDHIFSLENGDDWFYFEDEYTGSSRAQQASAAPSPFTISTVSGGETELLRLRYSSQPKHTVIHKGACSFTGIKTEAASGSAGARNSRTHSALTVQVNVDES
ncbi:hypothetical protein LTR56_000564 [Elasticomyces elasticus]|nr:hypothetical protein LTR56_000564 [Elasticomyces elasticus]KAK3664340.1 hypothetical protein LTR22_004753 [Elasticomyces elasticus]KAK4915450.1 hypothetical protein LTR49_016438 [Elasticomyces elasticus]KAK5752833.1 hypothetical protein LTS12_017112 [Elasticomyces elasticus]